MEKKKKTELKLRKGAKTNIGILLEVGLWKRFRVHCLQTDQSPGELVGKILSNYLAKTEKRKRKE